MKSPFPSLLLIRSGDGNWTQIPCSDFPAVCSAWSARDGSTGETGILCSGDEDVSPSMFDLAAKLNAGHILFSGGMKHHLPPSCIASSDPVATVGEIQLFTGLPGWEDSIKERDTEKNASGTAVGREDQSEQRQDWPGAFGAENPRDAEHLSGYGIRSEDSRLKRESALPQELPGDTGCFLDQFRQSLATLQERERDVLTRRLGFERETETLKQIGDVYGFTRERARQLELRAHNKLRLTSDWLTGLKERMDPFVKSEGKKYPLSFSDMERGDLWFKGISSHRRFFENLVKSALKNFIHPLDIDGDLYFGLMSQKDWERMVSATARKLPSLTEKHWSEEAVRGFVGAQLPPESREYSDLLWKTLSPRCHFAALPDGKREFTGFGHFAGRLIKAILTESDKPLHFTEITEIANRMAGRNKGRRHDVRTIHNTAANTCLLFARGTYGLRKHLHLSDRQVAKILDFAEIFISSQPEKQWHIAEILSAFRKSTSDDLVHLDKYTLDVALADSKRLVPLGKMTWTSAGAERNRKIIRQEVVAILEEAGGPLYAEEIRRRLRSKRGTGDHFQIASISPLVPLQSGLWGINDRDVPVKRDRQQTLIEILVKQLEARQHGIHESELPEFLELDGCPPKTFATIAARDNRLKLSIRRYMYLAEWGDPRSDGV